MNEKRYFRVVALGCRTNQYEGQAMAAQLEKLGWHRGEETDPIELCIVNTCTVTPGADRTSRATIRRLAHQYPLARIWVTGCLAERDPAIVQALPGVVAVVPNAEKESLVGQIHPTREIPPFIVERFEGKTRAFVKVQDGCNSFCSYCIIPYVRGRSRSKTLEVIEAECRQLIANGFQEIVLTGINIGDFNGGDKKNPTSLGQLVQRLDALEGYARLRISSIDPDDLDEELLQSIIHGRHTCHSMHIVLQSGSNAVLTRMRRKYSRQDFIDTVLQLKEADPFFTITTDVIIGFPGETEDDFQQTLAMIDFLESPHVHIFPYGVRPGTLAASYTDLIPPAQIQARRQRASVCAEQAAFRGRARYVGMVVTVLTEEPTTQYGQGHTDTFIRVILTKPLPAHQTVQVRITENMPEGLVGIPQ